MLHVQSVSFVCEVHALISVTEAARPGALRADVLAGREPAKIAPAKALVPVLLAFALVALTLGAHWMACLGFGYCTVDNSICGPWRPDCVTPPA